jgi:ankyrin repeat protein
MPEVFLAAEKQLSPPTTPPMATQVPPTGGLGVFAEEDASQAHAPSSAFGFNRSPPGLSLYQDSQLNLGGLTAPKEKDEATEFNEVKRLIISGDENFFDAIKHTSGEVLSKTDQDGMTALHYAAMNGRAKACDAILSHPGFISTKVGDRSSNTAMHTAALHDQGDVCHVILRHDPSAASVVNHFGDSPHDIARRRGNSRVCAAFENVKESQHSSTIQQS